MFYPYFRKRVSRRAEERQRLSTASHPLPANSFFIKSTEKSLKEGLHEVEY